MSEATATYTLGEEETFQCHKCGDLFHADDVMAVTAHPDGCTVNIRCLPCQEETEE